MELKIPPLAVEHWYTKLTQEQRDELWDKYAVNSTLNLHTAYILEITKLK